MTTYWIDASGGSPGGYTNFTSLKAAWSPSHGDIIEVVDNGEIDDSGISKFYINFDVIIRSWSGNTNRPTIKMSSGPWFLSIGNLGGNFSFQNIKMYKPGPDSEGEFLQLGNDNLSSVEISGCEFLAVDPSSIFSCTGIVLGNIVFSVSCIIERNSFKGASAVKIRK